MLTPPPNKPTPPTPSHAPSTVYMVVGFTGEYDDYTEWSVLAYHSKKAAEAHVIRAKAWAKENGVDWVSCKEGCSLPWSERNDLINPYDPHMFNISYTGVDYRIREVDLAPQEGVPLNE